MRAMIALAAVTLLNLSVFAEFSSTKEEELEEARTLLEGTPTQPPEEILQWLRSKKILEETPIEEFGSKEIPPSEISLSNAISTTLRNQWKIEISESEVVRRYGEWQESAGPFDPVLTSTFGNTWLLDPQQLGNKTNETGSITTLEVAVEKLTRPGTQFSLGSRVKRTHNPSLIVTVPDFTRFNGSSLVFEVVQPLLRGFLYNEAAVEERISSMEFDASKYLLVQTMSEEVLNSITAYWELVAAEKIVEINVDAQHILDGLTQATYRLVEKEQLAASELNEQIAEIARNRRDLVASRQAVYEAYNAFLFQIGERKCTFSENLPHLILDNFILPHGDKREWDLDCLLNQAYDHRGDLIAARIAVQEADLLYRLACKNVLPSLDASFEVELLNSSIERPSQRLFASYYPKQMEKDISAEIRLSIPFWNDRARGARTQRREERMQAFLEENELWSSIYSDIATILREQIELVDEIYYATKAAEWYEIALRDEIMRTKEGYGSLFVVIDFENRFRRTLLERVDVQKRYSQNIAQLLFLTGTLVLVDTVTQEIEIDPFNYDHLLVSHE